MRLIAFLLLLAGVAAPSLAAEVRIVRLSPSYRPTASFQRLSEFFTGRENTGRETVRRSQPANRDGYYWFLRLDNAGAAVAEATFELRVISPADPEPRTFTFVAPVPAGSRAFNLGVTGTDWPGAEAVPVAWKLRVFTPAGELATAQSFLWSKPAAAPAK